MPRKIDYETLFAGWRWLEDAITVSEAAALACVDTRTIRRWVDLGCFAARQGDDCRTWIIHKPTFLAWVESRYAA